MKNSTDQSVQNSVQLDAELLVIVSRKEAKEKGLKYYFTGKTCKHGHIDKRNLNQKSCYTCSKIASRKCNSKEDVKARLAKDRVEKRKSNPEIRRRESELSKKQSYKDARKANRTRPEVKAKEKEYRIKYSNRPEIKAKLAEYAKSDHVKAKNKEKRQSIEGRKKSRDRMRNHRKTAIGIHRGIIDHLSYRILNKTNCKRSGGAEIILGYSKLDLINYIESLWLDGMTWLNHGKWHIDHIKPLSIFIKEGVTDPSIISALSNLQPLWAKDNLSKGAKY